MKNVQMEISDAEQMHDVIELLKDVHHSADGIILDYQTFTDVRRKKAYTTCLTLGYLTNVRGALHSLTETGHNLIESGFSTIFKESESVKIARSANRTSKVNMLISFTALIVSVIIAIYK